MRIGFFNSYDIWGGGEKWHLELAHLLDRKGHQVFLYTPLQGELSRRGQSLSLDVRDVNSTKLSYLAPQAIWKLWKKFQKDQLDLIIFNSFRDARLGGLAAKLARVPRRILRVGTPITPRPSWSYRKALSQGINEFVGISDEILSLFQQTFPQALSSCPMKKIPNGVCPKTFSPGPRSPSPFTLGNCARLSPQKGWRDFLLVVSLVKKSLGKDFQAKIAGTGEEEEALKTLAQDLNLTSQVQFLGHREDTPSFYHELDVLLFTSHFEGSARTLLEAMACGLPVVCFDTSGMREIVEDGVNGRRIPPFNHQQMSQAIIGLKNNTQKRNQWGKEGRRMVREKFSQRKAQEAWEKYFVNPPTMRRNSEARVL